MQLEIINLSKRYKSIQAVDGVSFKVSSGEAVAVVGSNGSGKSSLLRMVVGLDRPSGGSVTMNGWDVALAVKNGVRIRLVSDGVAGSGGRTVRRHLEAVAAMHGLNKSIVLEALEEVSLTRAANIRVVDCSAGMRQRLAIAVGWLGPCDLLVMDEPTNSLDSDGTALIVRLVQQVTDNGGAVLLATHDFGLAVSACGRQIALEKGVISGCVGGHHDVD
ncbi:MAG: ABC transporter ATP-binding protein [Propionibacteriaceae bacterium]|nr:ABC transporter ATP-binding protein [Propionibacteriaceae bacterium]